MKLKWLCLVGFGIAWLIAHSIIHEVGHSIACIATGGTFYGFGFSTTKLALYALCGFGSNTSRFLVAIAGVSFMVLLTTIARLAWENDYTIMAQVVSVSADGFYWVFGGFIRGSDTWLAATSIGVSPALLGLAFLPTYVLGVFLMYLGLDNYLTKRCDAKWLRQYSCSSSTRSRRTS